MNYSECFGFKEEPFSSEVTAKNLLKLPSMVPSIKQIKIYLEHHQHIIGGIKKQLFSEPAISAIVQAGGGILRRTNHLARGGEY